MSKKFIDYLKKFGFEFLSIFVSIFAAFSLDNWNENNKERHTETKILAEIHKGLGQDIKDINLNEQGHKFGLRSVQYFNDILLDKKPNTDSLPIYYFALLRDFISIQNISGYETLKSKGLEIIEDDSLRTQILALYENDFTALKKLEEDYAELQFHSHYFNDFNDILTPTIIFDTSGKMAGLHYPLQLNEKAKKKLLIDLWKIKNNRLFILTYYNEVKNKIELLRKHIGTKLKK